MVGSPKNVGFQLLSKSRDVVLDSNDLIFREFVKLIKLLQSKIARLYTSVYVQINYKIQVPSLLGSNQ